MLISMTEWDTYWMQYCTIADNFCIITNGDKWRRVISDGFVTWSVDENE